MTQQELFGDARFLLRRKNPNHSRVEGFRQRVRDVLECYRSSAEVEGDMGVKSLPPLSLDRALGQTRVSTVFRKTS